MKTYCAVFALIIAVLLPFSSHASDVMCMGNFDFDNDVDGTDAATFKQHLGRSTFNNPCPSDGPAPVAKTGQTTSFADYDDGYYQRGVEPPLSKPRFTDNGNGTVTDNLSGLIWLKDANCFGERTWNDALADANGLTNAYCGLTDGSTIGKWRLPNVKELYTLIDCENYGPALPDNHPFINVFNGYYWSSSTDQLTDTYAKSISITEGFITHHLKVERRYVWPVRGGH